MNKLQLTGVLLLVLGLIALIVPIPQHEKHGIRIGDAQIAVQTEEREKLPPAVGIILVAGGVLALVMGSRKT